MPQDASPWHGRLWAEIGDCVVVAVLAYSGVASADKNQMVSIKEEKRSFSTLMFKMCMVKAISLALIYHLILVMPQGASQALDKID